MAIVCSPRGGSYSTELVKSAGHTFHQCRIQHQRSCQHHSRQKHAWNNPSGWSCGRLQQSLICRHTNSENTYTYRMFCTTGLIYNDPKTFHNSAQCQQLPLYCPRNVMSCINNSLLPSSSLTYQILCQYIDADAGHCKALESDPAPEPLDSILEEPEICTQKDRVKRSFQAQFVNRQRPMLRTSPLLAKGWLKHNASEWRERV